MLFFLLLEFCIEMMIIHVLFFFFRFNYRSFVPPARDEESETQRKAHAKRVRETRRSTQGVTLEEIKSAEELVKKKNLSNNNNNNFINNVSKIMLND